MCVSQFRDYCNASEFRYRDRERDMNDPDLKVRPETFRYHPDSWYYVTDMKAMRKLAKLGNRYAMAEVEQHKSTMENNK